MFRRNPAGQSSLRKFREERCATIRSEWRGLLVIFGATVGCAIWVVVGSGWGRALAAFSLGIFTTGIWFGWMLGFDAHSLRWAWGGWGEQWTAEELAKLDSKWRVYHDIPDGRANWDHVVVGSGGVFVIDSKNVSEPASVDESGLRYGRPASRWKGVSWISRADEGDHRAGDGARYLGSGRRGGVGETSGGRCRARRSPIRSRPTPR